MKPRIVLAVSLVSCFLLSSCGSSRPSVSPASITSGNWSIVASSGATFSLGGSLVQSGATVSGIMHVFGNPCFNPPSVNIPFTGRFDGDALTMKSTNSQYPELTIHATGAGTSLTGTYTVSGCVTETSGTIVATYVPPITGTWKSTFTQTGTTVNTTINMTADLTQSSTADANGLFPLSGTVTISGTTCPAGGTVFYSVDSDWATSDVVGNNLVIDVNSVTNPGTQEFTFNGSVDSTSISGSYYIADPACPSLVEENLSFTKQ